VRITADPFDYFDSTQYKFAQDRLTQIDADFALTIIAGLGFVNRGFHGLRGEFSHKSVRQAQDRKEKKLATNSHEFAQNI